MASSKRPSLLQLAQEQQFDNDIPQPNKLIQSLIKDEQSVGTADLNQLPNTRNALPSYPKFIHCDSKLSYASMKYHGNHRGEIPSLTRLNSSTIQNDGQG